MSDIAKTLQHIKCSMEIVKSVSDDSLPSMTDFSIQIEKIHRYRTYQIEMIRINNNSKYTIRLRKKDLVALGVGRTIAIENTLLKQGGYTKAIRLILM